MCLRAAFDPVPKWIAGFLGSDGGGADRYEGCYAPGWYGHMCCRIGEKKILETSCPWQWDEGSMHTTRESERERGPGCKGGIE